MMLPILAATVGTNFRGANDAPVRSQYVNELSLPGEVCRPQANKTNGCGGFFSSVTGLLLRESEAGGGDVGLVAEEQQMGEGGSGW